MALRKYKSSKEGVRVTAIFFVIMLVIIALISRTPQTETRNYVEAMGGFVIMFSVLLFMLKSSYIEIDEAKRTIMYCNWPIKSEVVPVDKIIQIGYPEQNYIVHSLNSFIYIWYDDPEKPGKDKYVKVKDAQFELQTIIQVALELKRLNPQVKFDNKLEGLIKSSGEYFKEKQERLQEKREEVKKGFDLRRLSRVVGFTMLMGIGLIILFVLYILYFSGSN